MRLEVADTGNSVAVVVNTSDTSAVMTPVDPTVETKVAAEVVISISDVISRTDAAGVVRISRVNKGDVLVLVSTVVTGIIVLEVSWTLAGLEK